MELKSRSCILWLTVTTALVFRWADSQMIYPTPRQSSGNCTTTDIFLGARISDAATDTLERTTDGQLSLLSQMLVTGDAGPDEGPFVGILGSQVVCEASGLQRNTFSSLSVVVQYVCEGPFCGGPSGTSIGTRLTFTDQLQFDCNGDTNTFEANFLSDGDAVSPGGNLATPLDTRCGQCVDPQSVPGSPLQPITDQASHCSACNAACDMGLQKCVGVNSDQCCNFYYNDACVIRCPGMLVGGGDPLYNCGCEELTLPNGELSFSDSLLVGSVATHTCERDMGYVLSGVDVAVTTVDRTCSEENGWSGSLISCSLHDCQSPLGFPSPTPLVNGVASFITTTFESTATFRCNDGYNLVGSSTRVCEVTGWSGTPASCVAVTTTPAETEGPPAGQSSACNVGCIIGIVLAVLGAIILAAVIAGVAYAIYSYKNHPDTKLAKYDPDNINGVARDNPLYVDPDAVVGDGAEAA